MRRVFEVMGTAVSVDIPNCQDDAVFRRALNRLRDIDERFSTYKPASEVSRFGNGKLSEAELSRELSYVIKECRKAEKQTGGFFSAWAAGVFDPSGYVKGWAIDQAGKAIEAQGYKTYCIGAGGDILARSESDKIWNIGVQDPKDNTRILNKLSISNGAVATSGTYERGRHIIDPKTKKPADKYLSVTITGPDIVTADVLATAVFAAGQNNPGFIKNFPGYKAISVR